MQRGTPDEVQTETAPGPVMVPGPFVAGKPLVPIDSATNFAADVLY
jgi:hypothetical protein